MTEPSKTPRTDAEALWPSVTDDPDKKDQSGRYTSSDFARSLEIETQELAEALEFAARVLELSELHYSKDVVNQALARHRAKQQPTP